MDNRIQFQKNRRKRTIAKARSTDTISLVADESLAKRIRRDARVNEMRIVKSLIRYLQLPIIFAVIQMMTLFSQDIATFNKFSLAMHEILSIIDGYVPPEGCGWILCIFLIRVGDSQELVTAIRATTRDVLFRLLMDRETRVDDRYRSIFAALCDHVKSQIWFENRGTRVWSIYNWLFRRSEERDLNWGYDLINNLATRVQSFMFSYEDEFPRKYPTQFTDLQWIDFLSRFGMSTSLTDYLMMSDGFALKPAETLMRIPPLMVALIQQKSREESRLIDGKSGIWGRGGFVYAHLCDVREGIQFADDNGIELFETDVHADFDLELNGGADDDDEDVDIDVSICDELYADF